MSVIKFGKDLPTFVKRFREDMELSQEDLAKRMGVHGQYVSNIERGVSKSCLGFTSRLMPLVGSERRPYLMDLVAEATAQKAFNRLKNVASKKVVRRRAK